MATDFDFSLVTVNILVAPFSPYPKCECQAEDKEYWILTFSEIYNLPCLGMHLPSGFA